MESSASLDGDNGQAGHSKATSNLPSKYDSLERSDAELNHQFSKSISLEPPPVVKKPPKVKSDSFSHAALSWISWDRTEEKDISSCSRSTHKSYTYDTTFRFLGFSMASNIEYKVSDGRIDTAVQKVRLGWLSFEASWVQDRVPGVQAKLKKWGVLQSGPGDLKVPDTSAQETNSSADVERQNESTQGDPSTAQPWLEEHYYVVVGFMDDQSVPKETLRRVAETEGLFQQIHKAYRHLRKPLRRAMSLKTVSGFGIYECDPYKGYHKEVELDRETERALAELWRSYCGHKLDYEGRWLMWIHQHFNNGSKNPEMGRLALEFKLRWSVFKVTFWGILPVLLSLTIGFWFMYSKHDDGVDDVAVAEAAWVIATYITTTSALLLALLAVITQFGNI